MERGIDVSYHNGIINWNEVKDDFAIIRLGYGDNLGTQDDKQFFNNVRGCINKGIPFGVYIYSYATNMYGSASIESEIGHTKRLLSQIEKKPFCVYIDMEDNSTVSLGRETLTSFALKFCEEIERAGYKAGVYANEHWFRNFLDAKRLHDKGYSLWAAKYSQAQPSIGVPYDMWQYTSNGQASGVNGRVDTNWLYNGSLISSDNSNHTNQEFNVTYQTWDDVRNNWLPNVVNDSDYAGLFGHDVCAICANASMGNLYYKVHYKGGKWLPEVKNRDDYAGLYNRPIDGFAIKSDTRQLIYRVHLRPQNRWLPWVTGYDTNDHNNGYAGILGQEIDAVEIKPN